MAKATSKMQVTNVTLDLNRDEAEALVAVLNHVAGSATKSPAKHIRAIAGALIDFSSWDNAAVELVKAPLYGGVGVRFDDYKVKGNS